MPANTNNDGNVVKRQPQYIQNLGFDEDTLLPMAEIAGPNPAGTQVNRAEVDNTGALKTVINGILPFSYDYIAFSNYQGSKGDLPGTLQYYTGGSGGTLVATLTIVYSGDNVASVTRT